jgi:hypothetical protein
MLTNEEVTAGSPNMPRPKKTRKKKKPYVIECLKLSSKFKIRRIEPNRPWQIQLLICQPQI